MPISLTPEQKQTLLWIAVGLAFAVLLVLLGPVLSPFIAAAILAYVLNPAVDRLSGYGAIRVRSRLHLPRALAVLVVLLLLLAAMLAVFLIVVPVLQKEFPLLQKRIPEILAWLDASVSPRLRALGFNISLDFAGLKELASQKLASSGNEIWNQVVSSVRIGGTAVLGWLATLFLIPVVLFYLLLDWHSVTARIIALMPRRWASQTVSLARDADGMVAQYLRGQLLVMLALAIFYSAALAIAGFDVALPVGILTGLLAFIPYLGFGIGLTLALVTAVLQFSGPYGLIAVGIIYGVGQVLESFILTPYLVGERIGLHPLVVIFALLAFGQLFGFAGVLLALPASAIIAVAASRLRISYLSSSFYNQP